MATWRIPPAGSHASTHPEPNGVVAFQRCVFLPFGSSSWSCFFDSRPATFSSSSSCRCSIGSHFSTGHLSRCSSSCSCSSDPFRALWTNHCLSRPCPPTPQPFLWPLVSPFASVAQAALVSSHDHHQVSGPFAPRPGPCASAQPVPSVEVEFGPSRLTRFLEMPLDRYVNILPSMINNGRFSHIGRSYSLGRADSFGSLVAGTLHEVVVFVSVSEFCTMLQTVLSFHGSSTAMSQLLLPIFQDWTYATLSSLPSMSQVGDHVPVAQYFPAPVSAPPPAPAPVPPPPAVGSAVPSPGGTCVRNSLPSYVSSRFNCRRCRLKFIAWQPRLPGFLPIVLVPLPLPPLVRPPTHHSPLHVLLLAIPVLLSQEHQLVFHQRTALVASRQRQLRLLPRNSPPTLLDGLTCLRRGCTSQVQQFCSTGCCDTHCLSRRCLHHCSARRFAQRAETRTSSSQLPPNTTPPRLRVCRAVGCHSSTHFRCRVGSCSNLQKLALPCYAATCTQPTSRRPHCSELVQPSCPVGYCDPQCTSPRCPLHDPLSLWGKRRGNGSLLNDGSATPTSLVQSLSFAQFKCRRLWGSHDAVHDGFMGLVSYLDQLYMRVVCVQEIQAPSLGTLPVDQSFRYDGPLGSYGKEAGFLFHSSVDASCIPSVEDSQSLQLGCHCAACLTCALPLSLASC